MRQFFKEVWDSYDLPPLNLWRNMSRTWTGRIMSIIFVGFFVALLSCLPLIKIVISVAQLIAFMLFIGTVASRVSHWLLVHMWLYCDTCKTPLVACPQCNRPLCPNCGDDKHRVLTLVWKQEGEQE